MTQLKVRSFLIRAAQSAMIVLWGCGLMWGSAVASAPSLDPSQTRLCHQAIARASAQIGVPRDVLLAISLTETGKKIGGRVNPWPWTVNMEGAGLWFATQQEALAYTQGNFARGARSFDIGCFQINYRWHHENFRSISDMFDPQINATYAAKYLKSLYEETGTWSKAAGFYHSRTPEYSNRYQARFNQYMASIGGRMDPQIALGHGSEDLQNAALTTPRRAEPIWPLERLNQANHSDQTQVSGSLVQLDHSGGGLLRASQSPLFQ